MKHILNKLFLNPIYLLLKIQETLKISDEASIILAYHSIDSTNWEFSLDLKTFEKQILLLKKIKNIVPLGELLQSKFSNSVAITFDDGYENFLVNALPILEKHQIPTTLFLLSNRDGVKRTELDNNMTLLSKNQVMKVIDAGVEIGHHSAIHSDLTKVSYKELRREVVIGKNELEQEIGCKIKYFAYPKGIYNYNVVSMVRGAGFSAAFTTDSAFINKSNRYLIPRYCVGNNKNIRYFEALISTYGVYYNMIILILFKVKRRYTKGK